MSRYIEIDTENYVLECEKNDIVTLFVNSEKLNLTYDIRNSQVEVLIFFNSKHTEFNENGVIDGSEVQFLYVDLCSTSKRIHHVELLEGSTLNISALTLSDDDKTVDYDIVSKKRESHSSLRNMAVVLENGNLMMNVSGHILKGAKNSSCHQKNNCLTFGKVRKAKIAPILLIDENDVEASHSLSSGTIDEEVLFYMNTRGISVAEAVKLLMQSYLIIDENTASHYPEGMKIRELSEKKVSEHA